MHRLLPSVAALCILLSMTARAQVVTTNPQRGQADKTQEISPEKRVLIRELLEVAGARKNSEAMFKTMFDQMDKQMPEIVWQAVSEMKEIKELTPAEQQRLREEISESSLRMSHQMRERFTQRLDLPQLTEEISIQLYPKYFSDAELKDLITFYRSSTGKHAIEIMPNLFAESVAMANERMLPVVKEVMSEISSDETARFQEKVALIVKSHHKTTTPQRKSRQPRSKSE